MQTLLLCISSSSTSIFITSIGFVDSSIIANDALASDLTFSILFPPGKNLLAKVFDFPRGSIP